jgi:sugar/nucleoside kinase (ribokinase family)
VKRLGVVGTMVWDTIYGRGPLAAPVEEWGGIAYALAALDAALAPDWEIVPLVKVGRDLAPPANRFLADLARRSPTARFVEVLEPNNRVTLHYQSAQRRTECLVGGVPPWSWAELGPMVRDLDALYLNFISGFELTLDTARHLRQGYPGPIYADLHSLFLGVAHHGLRVPQALPDAAGWFSCFDVVQLNEDEMHRVGPDPMAVAALALGAGVRLLVVTLGARGAVYFTQGEAPMARRAHAPSPRPIETARIAAPAVPEGDTTGCGDAFGATLAARLLAGDEVARAIRAANAIAARNVECRGAGGLQQALRGGISVP